MRIGFFTRFTTKKLGGEIIGSLGSFKQKKDEINKEFYEMIMMEAAKMNPQPNNQFMKTWFLIRLRKDYTRHIDLFPTNGLAKAKALARKLELGK